MSTKITIQNFPKTHHELKQKIEGVRIIRKRFPVLFNESLDYLLASHESSEVHVREKVLNLSTKAQARKMAIIADLEIFHNVVLGILGTHSVLQPQQQYSSFFSSLRSPVFVKELFDPNSPRWQNAFGEKIVDMAEVDIVCCPKCKSKLPLIRVVPEPNVTKNCVVCFGCYLVKEV